MKKTFVPAFFWKVSIDHILITSSLEKESIVVEKSLEKVLSFGFKNLYKLWLQPIIQACDTIQRVPFFDSCQLTIT